MQIKTLLFERAVRLRVLNLLNLVEWMMLVVYKSLRLHLQAKD